jgi:hypothetical protein
LARTALCSPYSHELHTRSIRTTTLILGGRHDVSNPFRWSTLLHEGIRQAVGRVIIGRQPTTLDNFSRQRQADAATSCQATRLWTDPLNQQGSTMPPVPVALCPAPHLVAWLHSPPRARQPAMSGRHNRIATLDLLTRGLGATNTDAACGGGMAGLPLLWALGGADDHPCDDFD